MLRGWILVLLCIGQSLQQSLELDEQKVVEDEGIHGYVSIGDQIGSIHYSFYAAKNSRVENLVYTPIVVWLEGGPGGSSKQGIYSGIGRYYIQNDGERDQLYERDSSWNDNFTLLFIDSPIGVGYSFYSGEEPYTITLDQVTDHLQIFLKQFFQLDEFKKYQQTPLFIFGQGFSSHTVSQLTNKILKDKSVSINLRGIGFGNGFIDPLHQVTNYALTAHTLGFIDDYTRDILEKYQVSLVQRLQKKDWIASYEVYNLIKKLIKEKSGVSDLGNYLTLTFPYDTKQIENYLNQPNVMKKFNVNSNRVHGFTSLNKTIYEALEGEIIKSSVQDFQAIINQLPLLVWNGQFDLLVTPAGTLEWLHALKWENQEQWANKPKEEFKLDGERGDSGFIKKYGNLHYYQINKCGRNCAETRPYSSKFMITEFIKQNTK